MTLENPLVAFGVTIVACAAIAVWVQREYGRRASAVVVAAVVIALVMVWINFHVFSLYVWATGSLWRSLVVFIPPLLLALGVWLWRGRVDSQMPVSKSASLAWLGVLAVGPALITFVPRINVASMSGIGEIAAISNAADPRFVQLLWWACSCIAIFVLIPVIYAMVFRQRVRRYGLSLAFVRTEVALFVLVAPVIAALVWLATADLRFQHMYPFYSMQPDDPNGVTKLLIFEAFYGLSFVALEFFFRGFLVHAGNRVVGVHAVALMALSYCLIHLGKPMPECLSSLIGGLLLGFVSLRLKSIAVGVVAHLTMAWGTDAAVLWRSS